MSQEPAGNEVEEESIYEEDTCMQSRQAEDHGVDAHDPDQLFGGASCDTRCDVKDHIPEGV